MDIDMKNYDLRKVLLGAVVVSLLAGLTIGGGVGMWLGDSPADDPTNGTDTPDDVIPPEDTAEDDPPVESGNVQFSIATRDAETSAQNLTVDVEIGNAVYSGERTVNAEIPLEEEEELRQYTVSAEGYQDYEGTVVVQSGEWVEETVVLEPVPEDEGGDGGTDGGV